MDSAIVRAKAIPGEVALKKVEKKKKPDRVIISIYLISNCLVSPLSYRIIGEPWSRILGWRGVFKIHLNLRDKLRDKLIRVRIPDPPRMRPKRLIPGMKPSDLNCPTCPYIEPGTEQSSNTSKKIEINGTFNCQTKKCSLLYYMSAV